MSVSPSILPVIMSGGAGTRLWPLSTEAIPKQFHALGAASETMLQETALRLRGDGYRDPVVICDRRHGLLVREQLDAIGIVPAAVILEPLGRNTAAAAVTAALWAQAHAPGSLVLLAPADHIIADAPGFRAAAARAAAAGQGRIVTFGITPTGPETGYGYIKAGDVIAPGLHVARRFVEKPKLELAEQYLAEGGYAWNAGIFLFAPEVMLSEATRWCPQVVSQVTAALEHAVSVEGGLLLDRDAFQASPAYPIDTAVMERTDRAAVAPCDIGWADVGSWSELWRQSPRDERANTVRGAVEAIDTTGSLLWSDGPTLSVVALSDVVVVVAGGHVLVAPKSRAQDVKAIVEQWKARQ